MNYDHNLSNYNLDDFDTDEDNGLFDDLIDVDYDSDSKVKTNNLLGFNRHYIDDHDDDEAFLNNPAEFTSFISSGYGTRPTSTEPENVSTTEIISNLQLDIPELEPYLHIQTPSSPLKKASFSAPISTQSGRAKMTDIGFKMSKMIMKRNENNSKLLFDESKDNNDESGDLLVDNYGMAKKRQKTGKRGRPKGTVKDGTQFGRASSTHALPPNVSALMGQANVAYVQKQYTRAIDLYLQVVQRAPSSPEPYYSLGLVYEEEGNPDRAASYFLIAAHLQPKADGELWRRIASLLVQVVPARKDQAIYCLTRAIKASKPTHYSIDDDFLLYWLRAKLQIEQGQYKSAITGFGAALRAHLSADPNGENLTPFMLIAKMSLKMSLAYVAAIAFENVFRSTIAAALPLSWSHLNILIELREVELDYSAVLSTFEEFVVPCYIATGIEQGRTDWHLLTPSQQLERTLDSDVMPVELKLKMIIAKMHLRLVLDPEVLMNIFKQMTKPSSKLTLSAADAFLAVNAPLHALPLMLSVMDEDDKLATPELCLKVAQAYRKAGELEMAIETYLAILQVEPDYKKARFGLSEAYRTVGKTEQALQVLPSASKSESIDTESEKRENFINWKDLNDLFVKIIDVGIENRLEDEGEEDQEEIGYNSSDEEEEYIDEGEAENDVDDEIFTINNAKPEGFERSKQGQSRNRIRFGPERQKRLRSKRLVPHEYSDSQQSSIRNNFRNLIENGDLTAGSVLLQDFSNNCVFFGERDRAISNYSRAALHGLEIVEWDTALFEVILLQAKRIKDSLVDNEAGALAGGSGGDWTQLIRIVRQIMNSVLFGSLPKEQITKWRVLNVLIAERSGRWDLVLQEVKNLISNPRATPIAFLLPRRYLTLSLDFLTTYYHPVTFRYLARLSHRQSGNAALFVLLGHQSLETQNYEEAVKMYLNAKMLVSNSPPPFSSWHFIDLCIGNALMGRSYQRTCSNQPARLMQALAYFLNYYKHMKELKCDGEVEFNTGRALQMSGHHRLAIDLYEASLSLSSTSKSSLIFEMSRYNLSRLYLQTGCPEMAKITLKRRM